MYITRIYKSNFGECALLLTWFVPVVTLPLSPFEFRMDVAFGVA